MLVCNVSLRPPRSAIAADIAELLTATDATATGNLVFATLVDDPASVGEVVDAYLGEIMLEAASADTVVDGYIPASYAAAVAEVATATETSDGVVVVVPTTATWDAATITAITLSGGNLVATNTGTTSTNQGAHVAAASGKTTGKYYFECTLTAFTGGAGVAVGVGTTAAVYANISTAATLGDMCYMVGHNGSGTIFSDAGGNTGQSIGARTTGDVIGVAVDVTNRKIWFRLSPSGNWDAITNIGHDPTNPITGGGFGMPAGTIIPFVTFGSGLAGAAGVAGNVFTANFGATAFTGLVPSGYTAGWPV